MDKRECCSGYPNCIHTMDGVPRKTVISMTNDSEVEMAKKEIQDLIRGCVTQKECEDAVARWHVREKEIAVIEARVDSLEKVIISKATTLEIRQVISIHQSRLAELRKEKV